MFKSKFIVYVLDTETTGLEDNNEIIELSMYRLNDDQQKTWFMKPTNFENISKDALRVNGYKIEDLKGLTKEGKERFRDAKEVLPEIENWMMEDMETPDKRVLVAQNAIFDIGKLQYFWKLHGSPETFPFGNRPLTIDTRNIALFLDIANGGESEYYNLGSLVEKYGVKKEKHHQAASDTRMTKELLLKMIERAKKI